LIPCKNKNIQIENSYKNIIKTEIYKKENSLQEGFIILKEEQNTNYPTKHDNIDETQLFYNEIITTQIYLDKTHEKYKKHFIELHGEDLYDKYYKMTDSHIYIEKDEDFDDDVDVDEYYDE